jgi:hypothetical protein
MQNREYTYGYILMSGCRVRLGRRAEWDKWRYELNKEQIRRNDNDRLM